jgi:hypothetical protein
MLVPAFLFKWAEENNDDEALGGHLHACMSAAWNGIFLKDGKQGTGQPFEHFMWHYEAVRRELLKSKPVTLSTFYGNAALPATWDAEKKARWRQKFVFPPITASEQLQNPTKNKWKNFDVVANITHTTIRYEPNKDNFPKYDWFTTMTDSSGKVAIKGEQTKHGGGAVSAADERVFSVKLSTKLSSLDACEGEGWLALDNAQVRKYLGPTMLAAGATFLSK